MNDTELRGMKRFAIRSAPADTDDRSKEPPGEIDLERILWDRAYRQRFLDELEGLAGGPARPRRAE